jgi:glycosyltransferase involved in cell wall biosynthesis
VGVRRILHVFGVMDRGGAETRTLELMRRLDRDRHAFDFLTLAGRPGAYDAEIAGLGGRVIPCPLRPAATLVGRLIRDIRGGGYDVVHSHVHHFSGVVLLASRLGGVSARVAHVHSTHDGYSATWRRRAYRMAMRELIARNATRMVGVSEAALESFWGPEWRAVPGRAVLYDGVDTMPLTRAASARTAVRAELGLGESTRMVIHVGRFDAPKNQAALVPVAAALAARGDDVVFVLAGDGPLRERVRESATAAGVLPMFRFLGTRSDVPRLLAAADLLVLPSRWEGLPGAVLEALGAGVPVVASPIAPVREIAARARGVTTADPDDVPAFATAIDAALASRERNERPTLPAVFTVDVSMQGMLACYE